MPNAVPAFSSTGVSRNTFTTGSTCTTRSADASAPDAANSGSPVRAAAYSATSTPSYATVPAPFIVSCKAKYATSSDARAVLNTGVHGTVPFTPRPAEIIPPRASAPFAVRWCT